MRTIRRLTSRHAIRLLAVLGLFAIAAPSCVLGRTGPEVAVSSVVVRNRGFFDVNVYSVQPGGATAARLGTVVGASTATFPLHLHDLQSGGLLVVRVHAIGAATSWTSPSVSIGEGMLAVLDVDTDAFGDCSRSSLHTILTSDSTETPPFARP